MNRQGVLKIFGKSIFVLLILLLNLLFGYVLFRINKYLASEQKVKKVANEQNITEPFNVNVALNEI